MLLSFAEEMDDKSIHPDDVPPAAEPAEAVARRRSWPASPAAAAGTMWTRNDT
jgi:hypothetical protein